MGARFTPRWTHLAIVAACIAIVEVPRELGVFDLSLTGDSTADYDAVQHVFPHRCGLPRTDTVVLSGKLDGNIGAHVFDDQTVTVDRGGSSPAPPVTLRATIEGSLDASWVACMVPLYKSLTATGTLRLTLTSGECKIREDVELSISTSVLGIQSCRGARAQLARHARAYLEGEPFRMLHSLGQ
jgi:hypothetical protein